MAEPQIIMGGQEGVHNTSDANARLDRSKSYRDLSTVCVVPTRGVIPARAVEAFMGLMAPMNQKFMRIFVSGMEVAAAYNAAIDSILAHPELSKWKYLLTLEEDNLPPPDGLLKLYESMDDFDVVGGLYWTKGEGGQPMAYGDVSKPLNFIPQQPIPDTVQPVWGVGMGFTLWKLDIFRDGKLERPFFETVQNYDPYSGAKGYTQDLWACERLGKLGYKFAVDTKVKVGHLDNETGIVW